MPLNSDLTDPSATGHLAGKPATSNTKIDFQYGKPIFFRENSKSVLNLDSGFAHKRLCGGPIVNAGDACMFGCLYCYTESTPIGGSIGVQLTLDHARQVMNDPSLGFQDITIRRREPLELLRKALLTKNGAPKFDDPEDTRVVFFSTLVDPAPSMELLRETADLCLCILQNTHWHIRLLSKSIFLGRLPDFIPVEYHPRLILGFSTGTLDDRLAAAIELKTHRVSKRLEALRRLQDEGFRTYGMICPTLPQGDYGKFAREICAAIRVDRCEHVWAEVINFGGKETERKAMQKTLAAISLAGFHDDAARFSHVFNGDGADKRWNGYAKATFMALAANIPAEKFTFLQY